MGCFSAITSTWPNKYPGSHFPAVGLATLHVCGDTAGPETEAAPSWLGTAPEVTWPFPSCPAVLAAPPSFLRPRAERGHPSLLDLQGVRWSKPQVLSCWQSLFNFSADTKHQKADFREWLVRKGWLGLCLPIFSPSLPLLLQQESRRKAAAGKDTTLYPGGPGLL